MKVRLTALFIGVARPLCEAQAQAQLLGEVTRQAEAATLVSAPVETVTAGYHGTGYVNVPFDGPRRFFMLKARLQ